jgi:hypothetical protein
MTAKDTLSPFTGSYKWYYRIVLKKMISLPSYLWGKDIDKETVFRMGCTW